jgi:acetoacetate decarboxylase
MASPDPGSRPTEYLWTNARLLAVEVPISRRAAVHLLPGALEPAEPPTATLFVADYPETRFGSTYREAGILLHAADEEGPALHCPWMVVDDDTALILGRELLGFPKKLAEISLDERGSRVVGSARRRGVEVLRVEADLGELEEDAPPLFGRRVVNVIGTPITGLALVELPPTDESIYFSRRAQIKLALSSSDGDALGDLQAPPSAAGRYLKLDFGAAGDDPGAEPKLIGEVDAAWTQRVLYARAL